MTGHVADELRVGKLGRSDRAISSSSQHSDGPADRAADAMKGVTRLASVLGWCLCWTAAGASNSQTIPFESCLNSLYTVRFNDSGLSVPATAQSCQSELAIRSLYLCLHEYCASELLDSQLAGLNESCARAGAVSIPPYSIISKYTRDQIDSLGRVELDEISGPERIVSDAVLPSWELFHAWQDTLVGRTLYNSACCDNGG